MFACARRGLTQDPAGGSRALGLSSHLLQTGIDRLAGDSDRVSLSVAVRESKPAQAFSPAFRGIAESRTHRLMAHELREGLHPVRSGVPDFSWSFIFVCFHRTFQPPLSGIACFSFAYVPREKTAYDLRLRINGIRPSLQYFIMLLVLRPEFREVILGLTASSRHD
jgi:hypothetical protein